MRLNINRSFALIMLVMVTCLHARAKPQRLDIFPPYFTVDMFVAAYRGTPHPSVPGATSPYVAEHARGYLAGVSDIDKGRRWCVPSGLPKQQADDMVVTALASNLASPSGRPLGTVPNAGRLLFDLYPSLFPARQDCTMAPQLTGEEFITFIAAVDGDGAVDASRTAAQTSRPARYSEGYLVGVIDATQGSAWCAPKRLKPIEIQSRVLTALDNRKAMAPLPDNAADLLLELYNDIFPCPKT